MSFVLFLNVFVLTPLHVTRAVIRLSNISKLYILNVCAFAQYTFFLYLLFAGMPIKNIFGAKTFHINCVPKVLKNNALAAAAAYIYINTAVNILI